MKALLRNSEETITERNAPLFIDWNTGAPLTDREWPGGPYILVNDYVPTADEDFTESEIVTESTPAETITINGKEYTVEEARKILGVKL